MLKRSEMLRLKGTALLVQGIQGAREDRNGSNCVLMTYLYISFDQTLLLLLPVTSHSDLFTVCMPFVPPWTSFPFDMGISVSVHAYRTH